MATVFSRPEAKYFALQMVMRLSNKCANPLQEGLHLRLLGFVKLERGFPAYRVPASERPEEVVVHFDFFYRMLPMN